MGHKVHPKAHRLQVIYTWDSKWFGRKNYAKYAEHDIRIREYLEKKFRDAHIDAISVERGPKNMTITIRAAKPGVIIGRGGKGLDDVRKYIERKILQMSTKVKINVKEVRSPALSARVLGLGMASDVERRMPFRRVMKQAMERAMTAGAQGVKVSMAGRLNGSEIARTETLHKGTIPLITMRSDVDYALVEAATVYGVIGIKVWLCQGEVFGRKDNFKKDDESEGSSNKKGKKREAPAKK